MNMTCINEYLKEHLSEKRLRHIDGVVDVATNLAVKYGEEIEKAKIAATFHDMFKWLKGDELNCYVKNLKLDDKYLDNNNLAHGKIAAIVMKNEFNITDLDILNAVSYHTTGRAGMSRLEKIIYIADAIEPSRTYDGVELLRQIVETDLDKAVLISLEKTIKYVTNQGDYLDKNTLDAQVYLKQKEKKMDNKSFAMLAAQTTLDKKAENVVVIDVMEKSSFADFLVIATGNSDRQVNALVDDVEDKLAENGLFVKSIEGKQSGWVLMDFGDVIVNVFTKEMREKYNIEKIWGDCTFIDVE